MNTVQQERQRPEEEPRVGDFYTVNSRYDSYFVSPETARRLGACLDRPWRPRWVKFVDVNGGRVWLRTASIESIAESTELQRADCRAFDYARRREARADRRWDDEE
ncbi:MAG TPA: hypothetical protein VEW03_16160 [Longimicrobiaceae bacterium]|nr:hypothetical protein [Longimicrobiaceae bacterium]